MQNLRSDVVKLALVGNKAWNMLEKLVRTIASNVSPLQGNTIENDERVSFAVVEATDIGSKLESVDWSDSIIELCRFESTTISNSSFERVIIRDSDLSGVTFSNCLLRDCLIIGIKARSYLGLDNCIIDNVTMARSHTDRFEIHNSRIAAVDFVGLTSSQLTFHQCKSHKRKGRISFADCSIERVGGLDTMSKSGVGVLVDEPMWRDLGDHYLRERGMQQLEGRAALQDDLLDEISQGLDRRRN
ncbi:MAG: hypothetical protein ACI9ON_003273 [Limisphaerales bacterium]